MRMSSIQRKTMETDIALKLVVDGAGQASVDTGIPFLDHMLCLFAKHGFFDLEMTARGDLDVDFHHTVEDAGLVLGQALAEALGTRGGIRRYGFFVLPMDEARAMVAVDLSGRPFLVYEIPPLLGSVGGVDCRLFKEFFQAFAVKAGMNLHICVERGEEPHHVFESVFKALAKALDFATSMEPRLSGQVMSTKGCL